LDTTLLQKSEYLGLLHGGTRNITGQEAMLYPNGVIDIAPYVRAVPPQDLAGYGIPDKLFVNVVYRTERGPFDLVHVMTTRKNVFLVVVIDVTHDRVHGHYLLDLNEEYGLGAANDT
jgi:hypothetical protein